MDQTNYKTVQVSRGLTYSYYFHQSDGTHPTLLFLHGFPSSSYDWRHQIAFFQPKGYGIVAPDFIGYGGTDKPTDPHMYKSTAICKDVLDILDTERIENAVVIGHDWGSKIVARLANLHGDRFSGFAFLALGYMQPNPNYDFEAGLVSDKEKYGYELFGYWVFFAEDDAADLIESHWDSFFSLLFSKDYSLMATDFAPLGKQQQWLSVDRKAEIGKYLTHEEHRKQLEIMSKDGIRAALQWYTVMVNGINAEDDKSVPLDKYTITKPVFLGAASKEAICLPDLAKQNVAKYCLNAKVRTFETGHWVALEAPDEVNRELKSWIEGI